jgi:hypothetical protein
MSPHWYNSNFTVAAFRVRSVERNAKLAFVVCMVCVYVCKRSLGCDRSREMSNGPCFCLASGCGVLQPIRTTWHVLNKVIIQNCHFRKRAEARSLSFDCPKASIILDCVSICSLPSRGW